MGKGQKNDKQATLKHKIEMAEVANQDQELASELKKESQETEHKINGNSTPPQEVNGIDENGNAKVNGKHDNEMENGKDVTEKDEIESMEKDIKHEESTEDKTESSSVSVTPDTVREVLPGALDDKEESVEREPPKVDLKDLEYESEIKIDLNPDQHEDQLVENKLENDSTEKQKPESPVDEKEEKLSEEKAEKMIESTPTVNDISNKAGLNTKDPDLPGIESKTESELVPDTAEIVEVEVTAETETGSTELKVSTEAEPAGEPSKEEPAKEEPEMEKPAEEDPSTKESTQEAAVNEDSQTNQELMAAEMLERKLQISEPENVVESAKEEPAKEEPEMEKTAKDEPAKEEPAKEEPAKDQPAKDQPAKEEPAKEEQAKEEQAKEEPVKEEPAVEEPAKEELKEPATEQPTKEEVVQEEPAIEEPVKEEPAIEEPKKEELAIEEAAKEEPTIKEPVKEEQEKEEQAKEEQAKEEQAKEESNRRTSNRRTSNRRTS